MKNKGIITFDLDGTLISTQSEAKQAYIKAFKKTFNLDYIDEPIFKGGVDLQIFKTLCNNYGLEFNYENEKKFIKNYLFFLKKESNPENWFVYDKAHEFLSLLKKSGFLLVIVSGNYFETGIYKLQKANLIKYFSFLSFNSKENTRNELMQKAIEFARSENLKILGHIGDAYSDVMTSCHFNITPFLFISEKNDELFLNFKNYIISKLLVDDFNKLEDKINSFYFLNSSSISKLYSNNIEKEDSFVNIKQKLFIFNSYYDIHNIFMDLIESNLLNSEGKNE